MMASQVKDPSGTQRNSRPAEAEELLLSYGTSPSTPPPAEQVNDSGSNLPPATSSLIHQVHELWSKASQERIPWKEFYNTREMSFPVFSAVSDRVTQNITTYWGNYVLVATAIFAASALWNLGGLLVFVLAVLIMARFGGKHLVINNEDGGKKRLIKFALIFLLLLWITGVGSMLAVTLFFSSVYCLGHAVVRNPYRTEFEIESV